MRKILILGISGFLGSHLAGYLQKYNYGIYGLLRSTSRLNRIKDLKSSPTLIRDHKEITREYLQSHGITNVINCLVNYGRHGEPIEDLLESNLLLPLRILETAAEAGGIEWLNASTILPKSMSAYSLVKHQFSEWTHFFNSRVRIKELALEQFYGFGEDEGRFVTWLIRNFLQGKEFLELSPGTQLREFIHLDDILRAFRILLETGEPGRYDVVTGHPETLKNLVEKIKNLVEEIIGEPVKTELRFGAKGFRPGEEKLLNLNPIPLARLGWKSEHTLEEGIKEITLGLIDQLRKLE